METPPIKRSITFFNLTNYYKTKEKIYLMIYACELGVFENKVLRRIFKQELNQEAAGEN